MKCKACNGKGYFTGCVYESDEVGFVDKDYECAVCHGTGQIGQTNEEWRKTCSTEEFAEEMAKVVLDLVSWNNDPKPSEVRNILKAWLKQPNR